MKKVITICAVAMVVLATAGTAKAALVAHWAMDDGSGTVLTDSTANSNDGTLLNGAAFTADSVFGPYALEFDGSNDYAEVSTPGVSISGDFSFALWINPNYLPLQGANFAGLLESLDGNPPGKGYSVEFRYDMIGLGPVSFWTGNGGWWDGVAATTSPSSGSWYHIAGTSDGANIRIYVNGALEGTLARGALVGSVVSTKIGGRPGQNRYFKGKMDDVAIWNEVLTEDNIGAIMNFGVTGFLNMAKNPNPSNGATGVDPDVIVTWDAPSLPNHNFDVYFGTDDLSDPNVAAAAVPVSTGQTAASYNPSPAGVLNYLTTYYWRVDTRDLDSLDPNGIPVVWTGAVWSFTTTVQGPSGPVPADTATGVPHDQVLSWNNFIGGSENDVYFGTDEAAVTSADRTDVTGIYKGQYPGTAYDPFGAVDMAALTTYYWRIDAVTAGGTVLAAGDVWEFTTADVICDPPLAGDINDDCIVDLLDIAEVASDWLACNLSPQFLCP